MSNNSIQTSWNTQNEDLFGHLDSKVGEITFKIEI